MGSNFPMRNESVNEMIHHFVVTLYEYNHNCKVVPELVEGNGYENRHTSKGRPIVSLLMLKGTTT